MTSVVVLFAYPMKLRGDFLENRLFFAKSAQNLVTQPAGENLFAAIIFSFFKQVF